MFVYYYYSYTQCCWWFESHVFLVLGYFSLIKIPSDKLINYPVWCCTVMVYKLLFCHVFVHRKWLQPVSASGEECCPAGGEARKRDVHPISKLTSDTLLSDRSLIWKIDILSLMLYLMLKSDLQPCEKSLQPPILSSVQFWSYIFI